MASAGLEVLRTSILRRTTATPNCQTADPSHTPLFYAPDATIQLTNAEPAVIGDTNQSVIEFFFSTDEAPSVFAQGASRGRYSWAELFGL